MAPGHAHLRRSRGEIQEWSKRIAITVMGPLNLNSSRPFPSTESVIHVERSRDFSAVGKPFQSRVKPFQSTSPEPNTRNRNRIP
eukprot:2259293-Rhodomonas_salina.2